MSKPSCEQLARDMLERAGVDDAQSMTAGDLVEIANLIVAVGREKLATLDAKPGYFYFAGYPAVMIPWWQIAQMLREAGHEVYVQPGWNPTATQPGCVEGPPALPCPADVRRALWSVRYDALRAISEADRYQFAGRSRQGIEERYAAVRLVTDYFGLTDGDGVPATTTDAPAAYTNTALRGKEGEASGPESVSHTRDDGPVTAPRQTLPLPGTRPRGRR